VWAIMDLIATSVKSPHKRRDLDDLIKINKYSKYASVSRLPCASIKIDYKDLKQLSKNSTHIINLKIN
jgi:hypothetical protein